MKTKIIISLLFVIAAFVSQTTAQTQQPTSTAKHATSEDSAAMNALVLYPPNIRIDIFEACEYPSAIVDIASLQKKISSDFTGLIGNYSKDEQENLWDMS